MSVSEYLHLCDGPGLNNLGFPRQQKLLPFYSKKAFKCFQKFFFYQSI